MTKSSKEVEKIEQLLADKFVQKFGLNLQSTTPRCRNEIINNKQDMI